MFPRADFPARPVQNRLQPRHEQHVGGVEFEPPEFVVLGTAERRAWPKLDFAPRRMSEVVPRHLAAGVRVGLAEVVAPPEFDLGEPRFFFNLAQRRRERVLTRLDESFREVPIAIRAQAQHAPRRVGSPHEHNAGRAFAHRRSIGGHVEARPGRAMVARVQRVSGFEADRHNTRGQAPASCSPIAGKRLPAAAVFRSRP